MPAMARFLLLPQWRMLSHIFMTGCCALLLAPASAAEGPDLHGPAVHLHQSGKIRVFYCTEGQHAVAPTDVNYNGIPDQVEDVLTQTLAAQMMFVEVLSFPDPFSTERFNTASFLDIHLRHKDVLKKNGVAYDEMQSFKRTRDPEGTLSLCFSVATCVHPSRELTPVHEFFHIIQNSITFFKNRWYTEGTARWSERALGLGGLGPVRLTGAWPPTDERAAQVFTMAYEAGEQFWYPLLAKVDGRGALPDSPSMERLMAMTYVDGTRVLKDRQLKGWRFIRDVLMALGEADDIAFSELGYDRWSEENQKSPRNDAYILRTVMAVARRYYAGGR
jgi:hypothetical protein